MLQSYLRGMRGFTVIWAGQVVSLVGSNMTRFALAIWIFEETGLATTFALMMFFNFAPGVLLSPIAGALVDRWNRKLVMALSDMAAALTTLIMLLLVLAGDLQVWHLYVLGFLSSAFDAFQFPAYSASITLMVDKEHYARTSGMLSLAQSLSGIVAPLLAAALLLTIDIQGVMIVDLITFLAAFATLLIVPIPQPERTQHPSEAKPSLWQDSLFGFRYIMDRPPLLGLQLNFFFANLLGSVGFIILIPMVLARTSGDELALGAVQTAFGVGGVAGGLLMSTWGGPKRRVHGVLLGIMLFSLLGRGPMGLGQNVIWWSVGAFFSLFFLPILNGSNQAIWQSKVPAELQGRVFSVRRVIAQITFPLGTIISGPLADRVLEPAMMPGGSLAPIFGGLIGTGPGAGMSLLILITAVLGGAVAALGYAFPIVRKVEDLLPDAVQKAAEEPAPEGEPVPQGAESTA